MLVCGGGPVGLTLALGLAAWDVPVTVVERHGTPSQFPKGRALSIRTMEIYRQLGLERELTDVGLPRDETMHFFHGESLTAERFVRNSNTPPPGGSPVSPTFTLACSQDQLERVLRHHVATHPRIDARFGAEVTDVRLDDDHAEVSVVDAAGDGQRLRTRWLVAADGAASALRRAAGIRRTHHGPRCDNVNILFRADLGDLVADRSSLVYTISNDDLHAGILTVDGRDRWLCNVVQPVGVDARLAAGDHDWCERQVRRAIGADVDVTVDDALAWDATAANAGRYRAGPLLLAGDAAHVATPYGGFGMNCGIADAHNLAWKLALAVDGIAPDDLVDTYEAERHPVGERTVRESARRLSAALQAHDDGRTRRGEARANPSDGLVLGGRYTSTAVLSTPQGEVGQDRTDDVATYEPSADPGERAPHAWLADGRSTLDLFGAHFTVLRTAGAAPALPDPIVAAPQRHVVVDDELDPAGEVRDLYRLGDRAAVAVRPDGHVAWCG